MQNIDSDLIRGNIDTIILKTMLKEDKYGLDIIKEVSDKSSGTYELKQPTLYSCLKRLENQELISSYWVDSEIGGKRHYYKLTEKGRDFYNKKQEEWAKSKFIIDNLLSNYDYEEYRLVKKDEFDEMLEKKANAPLYSNENPSPLSENKDEETPTETDDDYDNTLNEDSVDENSEETSDDEPEYQSENYDFDNDTPDLDTESESYSEYETENEFDSTEDLDNDEDYKDVTDNSDNVFELGDDANDEFENEIENENDASSTDDDYPVYFETKASAPENTEQNNVSYETTDQSSNELNFLSRLHAQENEEINTYYGDQKSYVNHLRSLDDNQIEQQDLLDSSLFVNPDEVNKSIDEFSNAVEELNNFDSSGSSSDDELDCSTDEVNDENDGLEFDDETEEFNETTHDLDDNDDLDELESLKNLSSNAFFDSEDKSSYDKTSLANHSNYYEKEDDGNAFEYKYEPEEPQSFSFAETDANDSLENSSLDIDTVSYDETPIELNNEHDNMSEIDSIISNNITATYTEPTQMFYKNHTTNYREKLGELSKYSRVTLDEEEEPANTEALEKAKDIAEITKELEEEGIRVKEHYKQTSGKKLDRNYLLANKINLMKSLILFFGYVFVLSALYIILNNTAMSDNSWFSITPFLIGFIPFGIVLLYYLVLFIINPYKKIEAKFHFRIMLFISIIVTIQLLLITYCVNLQLGFYSFTQKEYNHLYWIIPSIISFAPITSNLIYLALFKSKNFNV